MCRLLYSHRRNKMSHHASATNQICIRCHIAGKVQGVWFRASAKEHADKLGLTGWVRNLSDGQVELVACGTREKVGQLHSWLQHGPRLAEVSECKCQEIPWEIHQTFEVL